MRAYALASLAAMLLVSASVVSKAQEAEPLVIPAPRGAPAYDAPAYGSTRPSDPGADIANGVAGIAAGAAALGGAIAGSAAGAFDAAADNAQAGYRSVPRLLPCLPDEPPYDTVGRHVCR